MSLVDLVVEKGRLRLDVAHLFAMDAFFSTVHRDVAFISEVQILVGVNGDGGVVFHSCAVLAARRRTRVKTADGLHADREEAGLLGCLGGGNLAVLSAPVVATVALRMDTALRLRGIALTILKHFLSIALAVQCVIKYDTLPQFCLDLN